MSLFRGKRYLRSRLVKLPALTKLPIDPELERRQEIARRILVADGRNVDKPLDYERESQSI